LKIFALALEVNPKNPKKRGPECLPADFETGNKFVNEDNLQYYKKIDKNKTIVKDTPRS